MADSIALLKVLRGINARENGRNTALAPMDPNTQDPDGRWDCDNYAAAKWLAPDWPQGVQSERRWVKLPDGQMHEVVQATVGRDQYIMDNLTNDLVPTYQREREGWAFQPRPEQKVKSKGLIGLGQQALASR